MGVAILRCLEDHLRLHAFSSRMKILRTGTNPVEPKYKRMNPKCALSRPSGKYCVHVEHDLWCSRVRYRCSTKPPKLEKDSCVGNIASPGPRSDSSFVWHDPSSVQPGTWLSLSRVLDPSLPPGQLMPPPPSSSCVSGDGERGKVGERTVESACSAADVSSWSCEK